MTQNVERDAHGTRINQITRRDVRMTETDTRRYRRLRALLQKVWREQKHEIYAMDKRTEDALVKALVQSELATLRIGRRHGRRDYD